MTRPLWWQGQNFSGFSRRGYAAMLPAVTVAIFVVGALLLSVTHW
jgi:hypothetical protein